MKSKIFLLIFSLTLFSTVYSAETQSPSAKMVTDTFSVEKMTCKMCPITIRMAIEKVGGVESAQVDFNTKTAQVTYDTTVATSHDIEQASTNAGYPAKLQGESK